MIQLGICVVAILALFSGVKAKIAAYINIPRPQKYLVLGETTSKTFLFCNGSSSTNGLRISLSLSRDPANHPKVRFVPLTPGGKTDDHYSVKCTPEMPLDGGFANVSKAFCVLGIANAVAEDAGQYSCQVQSSNRSIQAAGAQVGVQVYQKNIIDTAESNPKPLDVNETDSVVFKCRISRQSDLLDLLVQWRRSGDVILSKDSNEQSIVGEFDYTLKSVNRKDAGVYQCVVISQNNGAVIIDSGTSTTLNVNFAPIVKISSKPYFAVDRSVLIDYHEADSLNCTAEGYPRPRLNVSRNGYTVHKIKRINNTITISFPSATGSSDGWYCCNASNKLGYRTACLKVRVKMPPTILHLEVTDEKNGLLSTNTMATLTCSARGKPPPTISLYDPFGQLVPVHDPSGRSENSIKTGQAATFKFNTSLVKEGVYKCFANNSVGNVTSNHTLRLSVVISFYNVTSTLMHSNESDGNQQCRPKGSTLCCSATAGNNSLTVRILNSRRKVLNSATGIGEKTCATVTKTGNYSCFAGNQFSNATRFLEEHVQYCSQAAITGTGIGIFSFMILLVVTLGVIRCIGKFRSPQRKSTESQPRNETTPLLDGKAEHTPSVLSQAMAGDAEVSQTAEDNIDRQIAIVSNVICYNWKDVFRVIEPSFQDGIRFLESVVEEAKNSRRPGSYWAKHCLQIWIGENTNSEPKPESSFLHTVHKALLYLEEMDLAEKLYKDFPVLKPNQESELLLSASFEKK